MTEEQLARWTLLDKATLPGYLNDACLSAAAVIAASHQLPVPSAETLVRINSNVGIEADHKVWQDILDVVKRLGVDKDMVIDHEEVPE